MNAINKNLEELPEICREWRRWIIRMITEAGSGHPGGSLSMVEILSHLYLRRMNHNPQKTDWPDRDRLILSKGHGAPALYTALAYSGYFPMEELLTLRKIDGRLEGHPDMTRVPGVEASTGSLGQGLSIGIGHALAGKLNGQSYRVYVILGDGEIQEGQVWEAAMFAPYHRLSNLTAIIDANGFQLDNATKNVLDVEPLAEKWKSFGWAVREINGHDHNALDQAFDWVERVDDKPAVIICRTVKGKGISFMEGNNEFHGVAPTREECERALKELK
ncbi:TPA: transketolase [bacterium]|nr:MAG: transketolase [Candidatus Hydrogenedentes bacterium CG1_02_42_14]PIU47803.1 MAG: transketolase [Candidatus Hydrogenedentes bacterium CG07_land_8_20_14_0_80_42_17]HBW46794.1 transketolase [bacterium]